MDIFVFFVDVDKYMVALVMELLVYCVCFKIGLGSIDFHGSI